MKNRPVVHPIVALGLLLAVSEADGQVFTPTFMAPRPAADVGVYLSDGPGDFSVEGIVRRLSGGNEIGLRFGLADTSPDLSVLVGGEVKSPLAASAPLDLALTGSAQGVFGGRTGAGFVAGLTLGHTFLAPGFAFTPYLHPRAGLIRPLRQSDFELDLLADIGFDIQAGPQLEIRFGIGVGDRPSAGIGFAWR